MGDAVKKNAPQFMISITSDVGMTSLNINANGFQNMPDMDDVKKLMTYAEALQAASVRMIRAAVEEMGKKEVKKTEKISASTETLA